MLPFQPFGQFTEPFQFDDLAEVPWLSRGLFVTDTLCRVLHAVTILPLAESVYIRPPVDAHQAVAVLVEVKVHWRVDRCTHPQPQRLL